MNADDARKRAEQLFTRGTIKRTTVSDYEVRSREVRQKIENLRSLRLAARTRSKTSKGGGCTG